MQSQSYQRLPWRGGDAKRQPQLSAVFLLPRSPDRPSSRPARLPARLGAGRARSCGQEGCLPPPPPETRRPSGPSRPASGDSAGSAAISRRRPLMFPPPPTAAQHLGAPGQTALRPPLPAAERSRGAGRGRRDRAAHHPGDRAAAARGG